MSQGNPTQIEIDTYSSEYVKSGDQSASWRVTYPNSKSAPENVHTKASLMHKNAKVQQRIGELQEIARIAAEKSHRITVDTLLGELEVNRQAALTAETPQSSAATAATLGKAKLLGLDKQVIDHQSSDGSMTPTKITRVIIDESGD